VTIFLAVSDRPVLDIYLPEKLVSESGPKSSRLLASRPSGEPSEENFKLADNEIPKPGPGQMLLRTIYLSLDPYMRGLIAHYNDAELPPGPDRVPQMMRSILVKRLTFSGFIVTDYLSQYPDFVR
jgi:NADPH-dependent curcumin reductase CurA